MSTPSPFLTARWIHLAMLNFEIDPAVLAPRVPAGTELDSFDGRTLVSMVGFQFLDTRVLGVPVPFHRHFDEINLRFYVRHEAADGPRRGVVFIKEIVPRRAIAWIARWVYNENYVALPIAHRDEIGRAANPEVAYEWSCDGDVNRLAVRVSGDPFLPDAGSEEEFISEHYWGYVPQRSGVTLEYQVEHPQWRVWRASESEFGCGIERLYGSEFVPALSAEPTSAFLAEGSSVVVRRGRPVEARTS